MLFFLFCKNKKDLDNSPFLSAKVLRMGSSIQIELATYAGRVHRFDWWFLDWTNQCISCLPLVTKPAELQTANVVHIIGPIFRIAAALAIFGRQLLRALVQFKSHLSNLWTLPVCELRQITVKECWFRLESCVSLVSSPEFWVFPRVSQYWPPPEIIQYVFDGFQPQLFNLLLVHAWVVEVLGHLVRLPLAVKGLHHMPGTFVNVLLNLCEHWDLITVIRDDLRETIWVSYNSNKGGKAFKAIMVLVWCSSLPSWIYKLITSGKHSGKQISHCKSPQFESNHRHEKVVQEMVPIHIYQFVLSSMDLFYVVHSLPCSWQILHMQIQKSCCMVWHQDSCC